MPLWQINFIQKLKARVIFGPLAQRPPLNIAAPVNFQKKLIGQSAMAVITPPKQTDYRAIRMTYSRDNAGNLLQESICQGNCCKIQTKTKTKSIFGSEHDAMLEAERQWVAATGTQVGFWWQLFGEAIMEAEHVEATARSATREAREAAEAAALLAFEQQKAAEIVAIQARRGVRRGDEVAKKQTPCSRLYSCVGDKSTGGAKPTTRHISSECWSHERTDPRTGQKVIKHVCPWLHPGEEGWMAEWETNRLWKPVAAPVRSWNQTSRFEVLHQKDCSAW